MWPHLAVRHEVYMLTSEGYTRATQQLADWWDLAGRSSWTPWQAAFAVIKRPSRSYVSALRRRAVPQLSRQMVW